jgi:hypothetical protein
MTTDQQVISRKERKENKTTWLGLRVASSRTPMTCYLSDYGLLQRSEPVRGWVGLISNSG